MALSNVRPAVDGRPFFNVQTRFRFRSTAAVGDTLVPGDFFELGPRGRAQVLDEALQEWAEVEGYVASECFWELVTELPAEVSEAEEPGWGEQWPGYGEHGWRGV